MLREGDMVEVYDPTRPEGYRVRDIRQVLRITPTGLVPIAGDPGTRWVTTWVLGDPAIVARPRNPHGPAGVLRLRLPTRVAHFRELARMVHAEALAMGEAGAVCRDITQRPVAYLPRWRGWRPPTRRARSIWMRDCSPSGKVKRRMPQCGVAELSARMP